MNAKTNNLHMFQKNLDKNKELKEFFVSAEKDEESEESDSSDSEGKEMKIVLPKRKKKNADTSQELLFQLINQHKTLSMAQKKLYKVKTQLESLEITSRYVKLDLNNAQVKLEEMTDDLKNCRESIVKSNNEKAVFRCIFLAWLIFQVYLITSNLFV